MDTITVSQMMSPHVATVALDCPVGEAVSMMRDNNYSCIVVVENKKPKGIITERDVLRLTNLLLQEGKPKKTIPASSLMTKPATTIREHADMVEVFALCQERKIRHLPVVNDNGELTGLLTQSDLVSSYIRSLENQNAKAVNIVSDKNCISAQHGDSIVAVDLEELEKDLKEVFHSLHTHKNPAGSARLQSRFV